MYIDENRARHVVLYLNSQLQTLWKISAEYVERHGNYLKPEPQYRQPFALAEFYFGKHRQGAQAAIADMMFHACFQSPKLDILCSHEILLELTVEEGHYNLDYSRASDESTAERARNQNLALSTFSFRVPFKMTEINGMASTIGGIAVSMVILDFNNAKFIKATPEMGLGKQAVEYFLLNYLKLLQAAGHHVLLSLPNFNNQGQRPYIDFSQATHFSSNLQEVHGVSIERINSYLRSKSTSLAGAQTAGQRTANSFVEYRSTWTLPNSNDHFHLKFGAPQVVALCNDEIIMNFNINEVLFYETEDFERGPPFKRFRDWKVAVLTKLVYEQEAQGNITRCKFDLQSAMFMPQFSKFSGTIESDEEDLRCIGRICSFMSGEYLRILKTAQYDVIYHHDASPPPPPPVTNTTNFGQTGQRAHSSSYSSSSTCGSPFDMFSIHSHLDEMLAASPIGSANSPRSMHQTQYSTGANDGSSSFSSSASSTPSSSAANQEFPGLHEYFSFTPPEIYVQSTTTTTTQQENIRDGINIGLRSRTPVAQMFTTGPPMDPPGVRTYTYTSRVATPPFAGGVNQASSNTSSSFASSANSSRSSTPFMRTARATQVELSADSGLKAMQERMMAHGGLGANFGMSDHPVQFEGVGFGMGFPGARVTYSSGMSGGSSSGSSVISEKRVGSSRTEYSTRVGY